MDLSAADLEPILRQGEGRSVEFKRGLPRDSKAARTLCAFANTRGGMLFVGITDRGGVEGVARPREVLRRLREVAASGVAPPLKLELCVVAVGSRAVVCCSVPLSPQRPHAALREDGRAEILVRAGSSNRAAAGATLAALRRARSSRSSPDALGRRILRWVERRTRGGRAPGEGASAEDFARSNNIGRQRARKAFLELEREGRLVGHGLGSKRAYSPP